LGGLPFLTFYNFLRGGLRTEWIYFTIVALLIIVYLIWMGVVYKKKIKELLQKKEARVIGFSIVFAFIALLPFLPLGNIAPRYLYLASFGYLLALIYLLRLLFAHWIKNPRYASLLLVIATVVLAVGYFVGDREQQKLWEQSGDITQNTLLHFRQNYASFSSKTDLYFVNTPVTHQGTWVFPVGLSDGLWFIYRENTPQIHEAGSMQEAVSSASGKKDTYIFEFDGQGNLREVKGAL
jgi:hypothetical protein